MMCRDTQQISSVPGIAASMKNNIQAFVLLRLLAKAVGYLSSIV